MGEGIIKNNYLQNGIEWENYDLITECEHCEQIRRCKLLPDPFISEVYPEDSPKKSYWCIDCWEKRKDEV